MLVLALAPELSRLLCLCCFSTIAVTTVLELVLVYFCGGGDYDDYDYLLVSLSMRFLSLLLSLLSPFLYRCCCCLVSMMVLIYSNLDVMLYYRFVAVFFLHLTALTLLLLLSFWA